jgi:uncharacterized protein YjbI with pentapeptide repeats
MSTPQSRVSRNGHFVVVVVACLLGGFRSVIVAADLSGSDLSHADHTGQNLRGADLAYVDLTMADLSGADLREANLTGAKLDRINLDGADLRGVIGWSEADIGLGISANNANFSGTDLRNAKVAGTYSGGFFEGANFTNANLTGATLAGRFHDAEFRGAVLKDAVMLGAAGVESLREDLRKRGAIVVAEDFAAAVKSGRDFSHFLLRGVQLQDVNLTGARLVEADFNSAHLDRSIFNSAQLRGAEFYFATAEDAQFDGADLSQSNFDNVDAARASFVGASLVNASLYGTDLTGADMRNADLTGADLSFAELTGADLSGANLNDVEVEAAIIQDIRGVSPDIERMLRRRAGRNWYEIKVRMNEILQDWSLALHLSITPIAIVLAVVGSRGTGARYLYVMIGGINAAMLIPLLTHCILSLAGGSPTAQLSAPGPWRVWFHLWPLMMLAVGALLLVSLAAGTCLTLRSVVMKPRHKPVLSVCFVLLTIANCLLAAQLLLMMAPDA